MLRLTKIQFFKILTLYILLALAAICCVNIKTLLAPASKRPFLCSDESLRKPFAYDTVSAKQLQALGIYAPLVLIAFCESVCYCAAQKSARRFSCLLEYVLKTSVVVTLFLIGLAVERLLKNVAKIKLGRLRPNFIAVCNPTNYDGYTCHDLDYVGIMDEYDCDSDLYPEWAVNTAFSSFPSGHTSLTSYSMVFLICYLHLLFLKLKDMKSSSCAVIIMMQSLCLFMIGFVGMSRVLDFKHHWSDVLAGFIGGSTIALVMRCSLKSQLQNMEAWLAQLVDHSLEDVENCTSLGSTGVNTNVNAKTEGCTVELVAE